MWPLTFFFWQLGPYLHEMGAIGYFRLICRQFWTGIDICRSRDLWPEGIWRHFRILSPTHTLAQSHSIWLIKEEPIICPKIPKKKGEICFYVEMTEPLCFCGKASKISTSWTDINPGRRFLGCGQYTVRIFGYFLRFLGFRYLGWYIYVFVHSMEI